MGVETEQAETMALQALGWLIGNDDLRNVFLGATGAGETDLRVRAADPEFLASVLDFLVMDDAWVVAFCDAHGHGYDAPMRARAILPGGEAYHWT